MTVLQTEPELRRQAECCPICTRRLSSASGCSVHGEGNVCKAPAPQIVKPKPVKRNKLKAVKRTDPYVAKKEG